MAIAEDIYTRCQFTLKEADRILTDISKDKRIDRITVQARRKSADIADKALYAILRGTFITPIDREDLWLMHKGAEQVLYETENAALLFHQEHKESYEAIMQATACCRMTAEIIATFPALNISPQHKHILRDAAYACRTVSKSPNTTVQRIYDSLCRVIEKCEQLITLLEYISLKNT